jgi:hypothetical protein
MNRRRLIVVLGIAALSLGLFAGTAVAGKKKATTVLFNSGNPSTNKSGTVQAKGTLSTTSACKASRAMKLFLTNATGTVLATLDGSTSDGTGNWKLSGKLPNPPSTTTPQYVQVKAGKRAVGKYVCKAGFSPIITITAAT